jgi:hypothetical protein
MLYRALPFVLGIVSATPALSGWVDPVKPPERETVVSLPAEIAPIEPKKPAKPELQPLILACALKGPGVKSTEIATFVDVPRSVLMPENWLDTLCQSLRPS